MDWNIGQRMRQGTLARIRKWIAEAKEKNPESEIDREALVRKIQLVIGATKKKANEYCDLLEVF